MTGFAERAPNWARYAVVHLVALALIAFWVWQANQPQALAETSPGFGRLQCVSYAPYYKPGESPLVPGFHVDRERIDADLARLARVAECVRLYSVDQGLDAVPELAAKHGLKVLLGAWIGGDLVRNDAELSEAIALANRHRDVVRGLIVGNEVLLRREQTVDGMRAYIERAQRETDVPVTYADVWEFWLKHRSLAASVDFATIHILPYWEDEPRAIDDAIEHVTTVMDRMAGELGKPLLIGETGWPSAGKQRDGARPGLVEQARYLRQFLNAAESHGWQYNVIEAYDQPWKRLLEGTVGGYWGVLDSDGRAKFGWHGPLAERRDGAAPLTAGAAGLALGVLLLWVARVRRSGATAAYALSGALSGLVAWLQWDYLVLACRNPAEWAAMGAVALAGLMAWAVFPFALRGRGQAALTLALRVLLFGLACTGVLLAVDGRYRDFPFLLFILPMVQFGVAGRWGGFGLMPALREGRLFAVLSVLGSTVAWLADWRNPQAFGWAVTAAVLAAAYLSPAARHPSAAH